jgi:hypothetical protein
MATNSIQKLLIARGAFYEDMYENAWHRALKELGVQSEIFETHSFTLPGFLGRVERRLLWGPGIARLQKKFIEKVRHEKPDATLLYQGHYFDQTTLEEIRPYTFIAGYHNDDPFGPHKNMLRYRLILPALPFYHGFHVYRSCNVEEALEHGVPKVKVLKPYYLPWLDYPRKLSKEERTSFGCDIIFAGHAENDIRIYCLTAMVRAGIDLHLHGDEKFWKPLLFPDVYERLKPIRKVTGEDYRKALCGAKIAACFFSKWNRDQYTRRSFEIPACGVFMLAERTLMMQEVFEECKEAEYFSSPEEFVDKVRFYLKHDSVREKIARAGQLRVTSSGHDIYSRMKQWLEDISQWKEQLTNS